jgi:DNA-binding beta-propeller fold protein YncE
MNPTRPAFSAASTVAPAFSRVCAGALLAVLAGCSSASFAPRVELAAVTLQWPFPPNPAKLTYVRSLTGFTPRASAGRSLRALAVGKESADLNAFVLPVAVAVAPDGRMAVADMGRRCVHLYLPEAGRTGTSSGPSSGKRPQESGPSSRKRPEESGRYVRLTGSPEEPIVSPIALAFDDALNLYLTDSSGKVFGFGAQGDLLWVSRAAGETPWQRPTGLTYSPETRRLYVVDTLAHRVFGLHTDGTLAFSFGDRGEAAESFNFPTHIFHSASSGAGVLYVTDTLNFRISSFDEQGRSLGAFGRHGDGSGDLAMPKGLAADRDGVLYVADSLFDAVQLFDREGRFLLTLGRRGSAPGEFWIPSGVFVSASGELYVADTYNRRVQVFRIQEGYVASGS